MKIKNIITIAKKELRSYLDNLSFYAVLLVTTMLWLFLFFRTVFLIGEVSLRSLFDFYPWLILIFVSAITMGSFSKEKDDGTLELLLTHPLKELQLILGKFISSLVYVLVMILFSLPIALIFSRYGFFDWGVYFTQIFGSLLFAAALISLGIFVSSLFASQVASLLVTVITGLLLILSGSELMTMSLPFILANVFERLSLVGHYNSISRGAVDLRDLWYFVSFTAFFVGLTYLHFLKRKFGNSKVKYLKLQFGVILFIGIVVLTNIIGDRIPGRVDFTSGKVYTLSSSSKKILNSLDDLVSITLYASSELPVQYQPILRETKDLLRDYKNASKGNISYKIIDPSKNPEAKETALSQGVQEIQFNVVGQEEFQIKSGFIGIVLSYAGKEDSIPFVQDVNDLEYRLTSGIRKLTLKDKKTVAFLEGHGEKTISMDYTLLSQELTSQFNVVSATVDKDSGSILSEYDLLIVAGPTEEIDLKTKDFIKTQIDKGKSVIFLVDKYSIDTQNQSYRVSANQYSLADFVSTFGVDVNDDMVYDMKSNLTVVTSNGMLNLRIPYPLWIQSLPENSNHSVTKKLSNVDLPWASSLGLNQSVIDNLGYTAESLLVTSPYAGSIKGQISIDPAQKFDTKALGKKTVAVVLNPKQQEGPLKGKIVIIGDSEFLTDNFVQQSPQNFVFGINAVSWLADGDTLGDIKVKNRFPASLVLNSQKDAGLIKYFSLGLVVFTTIFIGGLRYLRRQKLKRLRYEQ